MSDEASKVSAPRLQPAASYSFTMRLHMPQQGGADGALAHTSRRPRSRQCPEPSPRRPKAMGAPKLRAQTAPLV